jgi:hypothetical protein
MLLFIVSELGVVENSDLRYVFESSTVLKVIEDKVGVIPVKRLIEAGKKSILFFESVTSLSAPPKKTFKELVVLDLRREPDHKIITFIIINYYPLLETIERDQSVCAAGELYRKVLLLPKTRTKSVMKSFGYTIGGLYTEKVQL